MALVSKSIPNFINGVSQQPPAIRLAGQAETQENGYSDVVEGLKKRPPSTFLNKLKKTNPAGTTYLTTVEINRSNFHTYKRSSDEQYTVVTDPVTPKVYVYDIQGSLRYESGVASWNAAGASIETNSDNTALTTYLGTNSITDADLALTSVSDYTFLVNKKKVVAKNTSTPNSLRPYEAVYYMKQMAFGKTYRFDIYRSNDPLISADTTWSGAHGTATTLDGGGGDAHEEVRGLKTGKFFDVTVDGVTAEVGATSDRAVMSASALAGENLETFRQTGNPFVVIRTTSSSDSMANFRVKVSDDNGGNDLFCFKDTVANFVSLPKYCVNGFTLQVSGDNQKKEDNFYVEYQGDNTSGNWKECEAPSRPNQPVYHNFLPRTMPHTIKQNGNGSFTFGEAGWDTRKCGDDDTNPFPSFVGQTISDVFFHRNRLGFLSDENVIFSEASSYFNFFRVTVRSLLDSAPIDVGVSQNEVAALKHAIPFQEQLLMFSDLNQFSLSSDSLLTPSEVAIDTSTKFECDLSAKPSAAGKTVFFATKNGNTAGVREYVTDVDLEVNDAPLITAHIPSYLNGNIRAMESSSNLDMLVCLTTASTKEIYVYKWYEPNKERLQSSWSKWVFDTPVRHVKFNNSSMFVVFTDGRFEKLDLSPSVDGSVVEYTLQDNTVTGLMTGSTTYDFPAYVGASDRYFVEGFSALGSLPASQSMGSTSTSDFKAMIKVKVIDQASGDGGSWVKGYIHLEVLNTALTGNPEVSIDNLPETITIAGVEYPCKDTTTVGSNYSGTPENFFRAIRNSSSVSFYRYIAHTEYDGIWGNPVNAGVPHTVTLNRAASTLGTLVPLLDHGTTIATAANLGALQAQYTPTAYTMYVDHQNGLIAGGSPPNGHALYTYLAGFHTVGSDTAVPNYVIAGEPYNFKYQLSEQVFRPTEGDASEIARFQLKDINFHYNNTGAFDVTVDATGREPRITTFTGRILGDEDNILGTAPNVKKGSFKVGVQSQAKEVAITINNNTHKPCVFQSAEWEGEIQLRGKRL